MRFGFAYSNKPILHANMKELFLHANGRDVPTE